MSTIASPRPSTTAPRASSPAASTRSSLTLDRRRNRTALRDYYNLKASASKASSSPPPQADTSTSSLSTSSHPLLRPLTAPTFKSADYVEALLATSSLADLIGVESALVGDVRGLDGERKSLVYDNYSKLIVATSTIGRMREEMGPVQEGVEGVKRGVEGIVGLVGEVVEVGGKGGEVVVGEGKDEEEEGKAEGEKTQSQDQTTHTRRAKDTVRWVLDTPRRLREAVAAGKQEEAEADWEEVNELLDKWEDVKGVKDIKGQSISALHP